MATRLSCDGCSADLAKHVHVDDATPARDVCPRCKLGYEGVVVGRLDQVVYCDDCATAWASHAARETAARVALSEAFETYRATANAAVREGLDPPPLPRVLDGAVMKARSFTAGEAVVMDEPPAAPPRRLALLPDDA